MPHSDRDAFAKENPEVQEPFKLHEMKDQWHSKPANLRVINVGAGAAGLLVAYKMQKNFTDYELVCYEKNPDVGGTWYENRYPGCACDVPAHAYTYPFEPNPNLTSFYAPAAEIEAYFVGFANKYNLMQYIKLNSKVLSATWQEKGIYEVKVQIGDKVISDWCHVFVNATGFLNNWKWPKIPGLHDFKGQLMHSANWDSSCDWKDKTVGVIGTGSSAIQMVPQIQKTAKHLTAFMRSVTWISPPLGTVDDDDEDKADGKNGKNGIDAKLIPEKGKTVEGKYYYSEQEMQRFKDDPEYFLTYRKKLETAINAGFELFINGSETSIKGKEAMAAEMRRRIGPGHEELKEKLIPSWPPGCRRLTPGTGYLEALVKENVTTCHKEIEKVVAEGIVDDSGTLHKLDILVCATGFNLAFAPPFEVKGVNGVTMAEAFDPEPQVYLAVTVPKFPNYFVINGVRGNWANGSALPSHEVQVEYILKCAKRIQSDQIRALDVKQEAVDQLYQYIDKWHEGSVWSADCKSWYKNNIVGGKLWIWAGSALHYMKTIKEVRWDHYNIRYRNDNMWAFLGNGRVEAEVTGDTDKLAPYMRNSDIPWEI